MAITLTLEVDNQHKADELRAAWQEIVSGQKLVHAEALHHSNEAIMERARVALPIIENAIRRGGGQSVSLVRFLAALYNGHEYTFDLIDLRALDTKLANACLDYLSYDRLGQQEVHHHLSGGAQELHGWIERYGIQPREAHP
jgi:hypothetical protein